MEQQTQDYRGCTYAVSDIINTSTKYPTEEIDIRFMDNWYGLGLTDNNIDLIDIANKIKHILSVDLKYPIILAHCGAILDGKHRLAKAFYLGKKKVKVIIIPKDCLPYPIKRHESK